MGKSSVSPWKILGIAAVNILMSTIDNSSVNVALPRIAKDYGLDVTQVSWVATSYLLTLACSLLVAGRLSDSLGRKRIFLSGIGLFTLSSLGCALSPNVYLLIAVRAFQGIGAALMVTAGLSIVVNSFEAGKRGTALGAVGSVAATGLSVGPVIGGFLTEYLGWRMIFIVNLPLGCMVLVLGSRWITSAPRGGRDKLRLHPANASAMAAGIFLLLLALSQGDDWGYGLYGSGGLLIGALVVIGFYILLETRTDSPLLPLDLLRKPVFTLSALASALFFVSAFSYSLLLPFYLHDLRGFSSDHTGLVMATVPVWLILFSTLSGRLSDKFPSWIMATFALLLISIGLFGLSTLNAHSAIWHILLWLNFIGLGYVFFTPPNVNLLYSQVPESRLGIASAIQAFVRSLGTVMGFAIGGGLYSLKAKTGAEMDPQAAVQGFSIAYKAVGVIALVALLVSAMRMKHRPSAKPASDAHQHHGA